MYLIDNTYFVGKYEIPNINESNNGVSETLDLFIDIEVRLFMQNLLGLELFKDFDSYMTDGVLSPNAPQKWLDLVNGVEYDSKKWNGLIYKIGTYPKSLFTNYIWTKYLVERNKIDGNGNANVIESKNSLLGNAANQYFLIWNEFVLLAGCMADKDFVSLNQFINDKFNDYPTSNFVQVDFLNRFL